MIDLFFDPAFWATLAILIGLELALGFDNVVFVSTVLARVRDDQRRRARQLGLAISALVQIALLGIMLWIVGVERAAFTIGDWSPGWGQLAFLAGGLFLVYKAVSELHIHIEFNPSPVVPLPEPAQNAPFASVILQVAVINAVFSVDTVVTAIGITRSAETIVIAILVTTVIIYFATGPISALIARHRSIRGVALAFLLIIGGSLISEGFGIETDAVLIYSAIGAGALILALVKFIAFWRNRRQSRPAVAEDRTEPVLDATSQHEHPPADVPGAEPNSEPEPARNKETLEQVVPDVQQSAPKRRAPRRKSARKPKASPQG